MTDVERLYNYLIDNEIFTESEIEIAVYFDGWTLDTMETLLYMRTGYRSFEQIKDYEEWLNE